MILQHLAAARRVGGTLLTRIVHCEADALAKLGERGACRLSGDEGQSG
jgi:hypothetical protein